VGARGTVLHYDGTEWGEMASGVSTELSGVWGSSSADVLAVGGSGTIVHYDGSTWSPMTSGTTERLNSVWGYSSSDVFIVGGHDEGRISHYDGRKWKPMLEPTLKGTIEAIDGTIWTVNVEGESRTVDISEAEVDGKPDEGSHVTIVVMEEDGVIVAAGVEVEAEGE